MEPRNRRQFLGKALVSPVFLSSLVLHGGRVHAKADAGGLTKEEWMARWMTANKRAPGATLHISRFRDPMYFLLKSIAWYPNSSQKSNFQAVEVPIGFVTDLTSIPRAFWSLLRPDGEYTYPAIIHDYMYWMQTSSRETADSVLKMGMQDFDIDPFVVATIYDGVRVGGSRAWEQNKRLRLAGERRILKKFPDDPRVTWAEWKTRPDVFEIETLVPSALPD